MSFDPGLGVLTLEAEWSIVRGRRNRLLAESDWTQLGDSQLTAQERAAWQRYRQSLRDLPARFDSPSDIVWDVPPR